MDAKKAPRQDTAIEELAKLRLHKGRYMAIPFALPGQERFQMSGDDAIKRILFGIARSVDLLDGHEDIGQCTRLDIRPGKQDSGLRRCLAKKSC